LRELAFLLEPASRGLRPANAFLSGPPGTGKTASARFMLRQLEDSGAHVLTVYVNCWQESTRLAVLSRLAVTMRLPLPRRGLAEDEVLTRVMEALRKDQRVLIVVLDELDRLEGRDRLLYDLSRAGEVHGVKAGVLAVSNDPALLVRVEERVRSSLAAKSLEFRPYSPPELKKILSERARMAFRPGTFSEEAVAVSVAMASKNKGDARLAIELLLRAGRYAEQHGLDSVGAGEVRAANEPFRAKPVEELPEELSKGEELLLKVLKSLPGAKKAGVESGVAYVEYLKEKNESERSLRAHLAQLEKRGLVETWLEKNTRFIKLKKAS